MRFCNSISGKLFLSMAAVAVIICAVAIYSFVKLSNDAIDRSLAGRDELWAGCILRAVTEISGLEPETELETALDSIRDEYGCIERMEIIDAGGAVVATTSRPRKWTENVRAVRADDDNAGAAENAAGASGHEFMVDLGGDAGARMRIWLVEDGDTRHVHHSKGWIAAITGVSLFFCFGVLYVLVHLYFKRPLRKLLAVSCALASNTGDLNTKIKIKSNDELGWLSSTLNEMFSKLSSIISMIRGTADKVNFSAQSLSAATEEMNSITEETSMTVQNIARSTDLQAHKVEEMIKEIRNMERSVKQVANSAELAASAATNASETAAKGGSSAKEAVEKINTIYNQITESAGTIRHLGDRSNQIGEIVDVITDIADQTNLLALNAAIEAARAGEAGSGFAVVADEVRKLAEGSAKAAEEIAALIRQTQEDTQTAVRSIELGSKEVTEGKDVITRTGQSLDEIVEVLKSSSDMARRISAATKELSRGMRNVITSIDEISGSAEKNASATQETAASMEQMTSSMEDVASSAQKLSEMAIQLREHVGRFRITDVPEGIGSDV
jgi:methyl-accepting chemotaxis protein